MKLKEDYVIYDASTDERIAVAVGDSAELFNGLLRANKTAGVIIEHLGEETTEDNIVSYMLDRYDADEATIRADVKATLDVLRSVGALEE